MKFVCVLALLASLAMAQGEDPLLGQPFTIYSFEAGDSAQYHATVVRYVGPQTENVRKAAVLYSMDSMIISSSVNLPKRWIRRAMPSMQ